MLFACGPSVSTTGGFTDVVSFAAVVDVLGIGIVGTAAGAFDTDIRGEMTECSEVGDVTPIGTVPFPFPFHAFPFPLPFPLPLAPTEAEPEPLGGLNFARSTCIGSAYVPVPALSCRRGGKSVGLRSCPLLWP